MLPPLASRTALRTRSAARAVRAQFAAGGATTRSPRLHCVLVGRCVRSCVGRPLIWRSRWKRSGELRAGEKSLRIIVGPATPRVRPGRCSSPSVLAKPLCAPSVALRESERVATMRARASQRRAGAEGRGRGSGMSQERLTNRRTQNAPSHPKREGKARASAAPGPTQTNWAKGWRVQAAGR